MEPAIVQRRRLEQPPDADWHAFVERGDAVHHYPQVEVFEFVRHGEVLDYGAPGREGEAVHPAPGGGGGGVVGVLGGGGWGGAVEFEEVVEGGG